MMCGVHCINALLQGPYFDEVSMSNIALSLDQKEKDIMAESGLSSATYLKYMQVSAMRLTIIIGGVQQCG